MDFVPLPGVGAHQPLAALQWLNPLFHPAHDQVIHAFQPFMLKLVNPPCQMADLIDDCIFEACLHIVFLHQQR
jgi:hypothetical protein